MLCPALLPKHLSYCEESADEEDLFKVLKQKPIDLVLFLEYACADETWSEQHSKLMCHMLRWVTKRFYLDKLELLQAQRLVTIIQEHISILRPYLYFPAYLYFNTIFLVGNKEMVVNSLMFGASCEHFHQLIRSIWDQQKNELVLRGVSLPMWHFIEEYINTGTVEGLWKQDEEFVQSLMHQAKAWDLSGLVLMCANVLKVYLTRDNAIEALLQAHRQGYANLKHACYNFLNQQEGVGLRFHEKGEKDLFVEILDYKELTKEKFSEVAPEVTHLSFGGDLANDVNFSRMIAQCPKAIGIDLSGSQRFSDYFETIPPRIVELDLSGCPWLNDDAFKRVVEICPQLKTLRIRSDVLLTYVSWGNLMLLKHLTSLDLSRCTQIGDEDLKLIAQSATGLRELKLEGCQNITDVGVRAILSWCRNLTNLDVSGCKNISEPLLTEIKESKNM
jgi:hypothetical protein